MLTWKRFPLITEFRKTEAIRYTMGLLSGVLDRALRSVVKRKP